MTSLSLVPKCHEKYDPSNYFKNVFTSVSPRLGWQVEQTTFLDKFNFPNSLRCIKLHNPLSFVPICTILNPFFVNTKFFVQLSYKNIFNFQIFLSGIDITHNSFVYYHTLILLYHSNRIITERIWSNRRYPTKWCSKEKKGYFEPHFNYYSGIKIYQKFLLSVRNMKPVT